MNLRWNVRMTFAVGVLAVLALLVLVLPLGAQIDNQDWGGSGGGGCNYCSLPACGCSAPPPGTVLVYSCSCSSISCTRNCDYR